MLVSDAFFRIFPEVIKNDFSFGETGCILQIGQGGQPDIFHGFEFLQQELSG